MRILKTVLTILALQVGALYGQGAETNTPPVAVSDVATTSEDVAVAVDPRVNDSDADGDPLTLTAATTTNGTVVIVGGTNVVFTPGTNFNGTAVINYTISDGQGGTASATVSVTVTPVNDAPVAGNLFVTTPEDTATNLVVSGSDVDSTNLTYAILSNPTNGSLGVLNTNTGAGIYTPATNYNGSDSFTFTVFDGSLYATGTVSITVTPVNDAPVVGNLLVTTPEDTATNLVVTGSDVDSTNLAYAILSGPTHGTLGVLNTNTGTVIYTPATNYNGGDSFTFTIFDGSLNATGTVSITVTPVNDAPVAGNLSITTPEDTATNLVVTGSDVDSTNLTYAILSNPTNGTLGVLNTNTGAVIYTPATNYNGGDSFVFTVFDGSLYATGAVSIAVTPVNDAPVVGNLFVTTPEDTATNLVVTGSDLDSTNLTYAILSNPTHGVLSMLNTNTGAVIYTPATNYNGGDSFTFTVFDGSLYATGAVSITVTPVNDAPVAGNLFVTTPEDTATNLVVSVSDVDSTNLTYAILSNPTHGVLSVLNTNTGAVIYTPATNYNGSDSFVFTVFDGSLYATGTVSITVTPVNDAPVAVNDTASTAKNVPVIIRPLANDVDVDGDGLTITSVAPTNGVASVVGATNVLFTPGSNFLGVATIGYTISDGHGGTAAALITVNVTGGIYTFSGVNTSIPDGTATGIQDVHTITSEIVELTAVRVRLKLSGDFNGDLYGYVRHNSGQAIHISVLLNRPGRTASDPHGYSNSGLDVTFADAAAADIHNYQSVTNPSPGQPLSGAWQPDARFVDPTGVTSESPRSAFLSVFNGLNASGAWTLFLADMDAGGTNFLESWGLELSGKVLPPITWAAPSAITFGMALGPEQLNATAYVPGTFSYSPPAGTVLNAGQGQALSFTFVPDDTNQYAIATGSVALDVLAQPLTITAGSTNKTYGGTVTFAGTEFTANGLVNGDTVTSVTLTSAGKAATAPVGGYSIVPSAPAGTLTAANYNISYVPGSLTVNPAVLTATVQNQSRAYGHTNPVFTVFYTGLVNGENANIVTGPSPSTIAGTNSPIGSYAITLSSQSAPNYSITHVNGTLTIEPTPLVVAANNARRAHGQTNPVFTATISGLVNGENTNVLNGTLVLSTAANEDSPAGTYPIVPSGLTSTNYAIQFTNGTLTVTPYALVVSADNASRAYGALDPSFTGSVIGLQPGDNITAILTTSATPASPVGTYAIVPSLNDPGGKLTNYTVTLNQGLLTINPAPLIARVQNQSRVYGQTNPPFPVTYEGFVNGENASLVTGPNVGTTTAQTNSPVGLYPISVSGQSATNYSIISTNGTLTIQPAPLVVAADNMSRGYGQTNPVLTTTISGLVNGESTNVLNGTLVLSTPANNLSPVGTYPIVPSGLTSTNYAIQFTNGTLTVTPYALVVSPANASRTYGALNPIFTGSVVGLQNGDNISAIYATSATTSSPVGTYAIVPSLNDPNGKLTNYTVTLNQALLTVNPAPLTATVQNQSRAYGHTNPVFTVICTGLVNGENANIVTGPSPSTIAGTNSPIGSYPITLSGQSAPNYSITHVNGTLTIEPTPLVVAANNARRAHGQTNPVFTATISGLVNGENTNVLNGTLVLSTPADNLSPVGTYPIVPSGLTSANYAIQFTNGTLTVTPYALVVSADNASRSYGALDPSFTGSVVGLQNGDNITAIYATSATTASPVGTYAIVPSLNDSDGKLTNYTVTLNQGLLTINPAPLTARVQNQSRVYGQTNPPFPIVYEGFVNGENASLVTGPNVGTTTAQTNSPVGLYPISISGQSATNYSIISTNGTLTIVPAPMLVAANNARRAHGQTNPVLTATISGLVNGENTNVLNGTLVLSTAANEDSPVGTYPIVPSGLTSTNYAIQFINGTLTVTPYALVVSPDNASRTYGALNPIFTGSLGGLQAGDNITAIYTTSATTSSPVGAYAIVPALNDPGGKLTNYTVTLNQGLLTVVPAPLLVKADDASRQFGQTNPPFTATISGLTNGEGISVLGGTLVLSTPADIASSVGTYLIVPSGLTASNYGIQFSNGTLTISKAASVAAVVSSLNPALPNSAVRFTASMTALPPGTVRPSGAVQFKVDGVNYGTPVTLVEGSAGLTTSTLPWGSHSVSIEYSGDSNFSALTNMLSAPQIINTPPVAGVDVVQRAPTRGTKMLVTSLLTNDSDPDGENVVFNSVSTVSAAGATVKLAAGWILYTPPAGFTNADSFSYTIRDELGGLGVGTVTVTPLANETPTRLTIAKLSTQARRLGVSGPANATYTFQYTDSLRPPAWLPMGMGMADSSGHIDFDDTTLPAPARRFYRALYQQDMDAVLPLGFSLTSSANPAQPGSPLTLTASLTALAPGSGSPSGAMQFKVDGANYGAAVNLTGGIASITTATLPWGLHSISAEYTGDGNFSSATNMLPQLQTINTPPVAGPYVLQRSPTTGTKLPLSSLLALGSDADGETTTFDGFSPKSTEGGTLGLTNGWIYYTPPSGPVNADSFTYTIHDSFGALGVGTVSITTVVGTEGSPNLTVLDLGAGNYRILFSGVPWRDYTIQYAQSLPSLDWQFLGSRTADSHGQFEYDDALPEGTPSRFYRAVDQGNSPVASSFRVAVWTNFIAQTNGRTMDMWSTRSLPAGWPNTPPLLAWNTNCLLYGLAGFTAISQCSEFEGAPGQIPVTLVTRRHGFLRGHGLGSVGLQTNGLAGQRVWFCTASNTVVQMTIAAHFVRLDALYDYSLVIFTQDVPDSITPISVISAADFQIYYYNTPEIPFLTLGTEQAGHCATGATGGDPIAPFIYPLFKGGDSGSPNMLPSPDNKLIMFSGRGVSGFGPQTQPDIDTLSLYIGLNTNNYHLRWYDLSPWAP